MSHLPGGEADRSPPLDVVVVGRANIDLTVRVPHLPTAGRTTFASSPATTTPGGKSLTQALAARAAGARTALVGNAGADEWGTLLKRALTDAMVDTSCFQLVPAASTGIAIVEVTPDGENHIVLSLPPAVELTGGHVRSRLDRLHPPVTVTQLDLQPDAVEAVLRHHHAGILIGNLVPHPALGNTALARLDLFVSNEHEAAAILGHHHQDPAVAAAELRELGPRAAVVTAGARGAAYSGPDHTALVPAPPVHASNTTGAGDTFLGTLAAQLAQKTPLPQATTHAVTTATNWVQTRQHP